MGLRGPPLPPGLMLDEGDQLGLFELLAEWIAYLYESRFDQLLQAMILACLYDALWTPCLFLLPMSVSPDMFVAGNVVDAVWAVSIVVGIKVWEMHRQAWELHRRRILWQLSVDFAVCMPWELIGYITAVGQPLFWLRMMIKVRAAAPPLSPPPPPLVSPTPSSPDPRSLSLWRALGSRSLSAARLCSRRLGSRSLARSPSRSLAHSHSRSLALALARFRAVSLSRSRSLALSRARRSCSASSASARCSRCATARTCAPTGTKSRSGCS